jgi:hypothetical protein
MNLVWSTERDQDSELDLQNYAYDILEMAKDCLRDDGYLDSAAFVIEPNGIHCFQIGHKSWEYKREIYDRLVQTAKEMKAEAIVTLNDAYWSDNYDPATYYQGKLAEEGNECISVTVTTPEKASWVLQTNYKRIGDKIVFEPTERSDDDKIGLLGSWSKEMREIQ